MPVGVIGANYVGRLATVERVRVVDKACRSFTAQLAVLEKLPAALLREAFGNGMPDKL